MSLFRYQNFQIVAISAALTIATSGAVYLQSGKSLGSDVQDTATREEMAIALKRLESPSILRAKDIQDRQIAYVYIPRNRNDSSNTPLRTSIAPVGAFAISDTGVTAKVGSGVDTNGKTVNIWTYLKQAPTDSIPKD